jgi:hypothetical protein
MVKNTNIQVCYEKFKAKKRWWMWALALKEKGRAVNFM